MFTKQYTSFSKNLKLNTIISVLFVPEITILFYLFINIHSN